MSDYRAGLSDHVLVKAFAFVVRTLNYYAVTCLSVAVHKLRPLYRAHPCELRNLGRNRQTPGASGPRWTMGQLLEGDRGRAQEPEAALGTLQGSSRGAWERGIHQRRTETWRLPTMMQKDSFSQLAET